MNLPRLALVSSLALCAAGCASAPRHGHHFWNDFEIHPRGVDPSVLGIPLAKLERVLGPDFTISAPVAEGRLSGWREVSTREGQLLYYVLPSSDGRIDKILVIDPRFSTPEGIGAGATVEAAAKAYGSPVFARVVGGLETTMFPALNGRSISLLIAPPDGARWAGDYRKNVKAPDGRLHTTRWLPGSTVRAVEISSL